MFVFKYLLMGMLFFMMTIINANAANKPILVLDMPNVSELPKRFRTTSDVMTHSSVNQEGLKSLKLVASGQFSEKALVSVKEKLHISSLTLMDLRQESHGFINGNAISWYAIHNAINENKSKEQIETQQETLLTSLKKQKHVTVYKIIAKAPGGILKHVEPIQYEVEEVLSERELAKKHKDRYHRFYVQDFHRPSDEMVDHFVAVVKNMKKNEWVYFHCRAGSGRSSTFMVMFDMMRNAKNVSFDDILTRQQMIGGKDLRILPAKNAYKYPFALARLKFIKQFYVYCHDNHDNYLTSWKKFNQF